MASFMHFHSGATTYSSWKHPTYAMHLSRRISPSFALSKTQPVLSVKNSPPIGKKLRFLGSEQLIRPPRDSAQSPLIKATSEECFTSPDDDDIPVGILIFAWNVLFVLLGLCTRGVYDYFRFPFFVSVVQLLVSVTWCTLNCLFGFHKPASLNMDLLKVVVPIGVAHAIGIAMSNFCMAYVGGSLQDIITALEPLFTGLASHIVLGYRFPFSLWFSVATVEIGVLLSSATYYFKWREFISVMMYTISFTYRNIYSKKAMKRLDSTSLYAYTSLVALCFCIPLAVLIEGPNLMQYGFKNAIAKSGMDEYLTHLLGMGALYHITSKVAINILKRVDPLTQAVGNVSERILAICFTCLAFGTKLPRRREIGTLMSICCIIIYSKVISNVEKQRKDQGLS